MSTSFHPQTDGLSECTIRSVTQILRSMVDPNQRNWVDQIPMTEFAVNSAISSTMGFTPFELNIGYMPRMIHDLPSTSPFRGVDDFVKQAVANLDMAHDAMIASHVRQTTQANRHRQDGTSYRVGELVYLSTKNLALPKGRARKLMLRYIGPYEVIEANVPTSTFTLKLPPELQEHQIHNKFHASLLRPHNPNDDALFPTREAKSYYNFGQNPEEEWQVEEITSHCWTAAKSKFQVKWTYGDSTWEPYTSCKELEALDEYLRLQGVQSWRSLPRNK